MFCCPCVNLYEKLWNDAAAAFARGEHAIDPCLSDTANDSRRGVTLVFRPPPAVRDAVRDDVVRLAAVCPGQYFYRPEQLHVTVLSIITMTRLWREEMPRFEACRAMIGGVLGRQQSFKVRFRGVTAAPDSVMIQGFPVEEGLAPIRDALREAFTRAGFGDMPDRRYKVSGAHITVMRFCRECRDLKGLLTFLKASRETDFGECEVTNLELIWADWYASADRVKTLEEYRLT